MSRCALASVHSGQTFITSSFLKARMTERQPDPPSTNKLILCSYCERSAGRVPSFMYVGFLVSFINVVSFF